MFRYPFGILWIAFAVLWIASSATLGHVYHWISGLPLILEILVWIVFLPWVGSLFIWHSTALALWLKIVIIVVIALVTTGGASRWRAAKRRPSTWNKTRSV